MIKHLKFPVLFLSFLLTASSIFAGGIQINLNDLCEELLPNKTAYQSDDIVISMPIKSLLSLKNLCDKAQDNQVDFVGLKEKVNNNDDDDKQTKPKWEVRLFFGFARTNYWKTDITVGYERSKAVKIEDVPIQERHSGSFYNIANWNSLQNAFQWIDEPTNRIELTLQKGPHVIYVSYFHPKYFIDNSNPEVLFNTSSGPQTFKEAAGGIDSFQMSLGNAEVTLGYGRQFKLLGKKADRGFYITPRIAAGPITSIFRYNRLVEKEVETIVTPLRVDGFSIQAGARLEYKYKKLGVFLDASYISRWVNHQDKDIGLSVKYNLQYSPVTMGVSYQIFKFFKKKKLNLSL